MKPLRSILTAAFALAVLSAPARAVTFQVISDNTGSTGPAGKIAKAAGAATTLPVSAKSTAFISFSVGNSGVGASAVTAARLVIFFPKVTKAGTLGFSVNTSAFTEFPTPPATSSPVPTFDAPFTSRGVAVANSKNFLTIDVTTEVKSWLANPITDFGFAISGDSTVNATIGSKEGSGSGYPAVLEVDVNDQGGSAFFAGSVGIGTNSPITPLNVSLGANEVTVGSDSALGSIGLGLTNTSHDLGNSGKTNEVGLGFDGGNGIRQAIVGGTFNVDFLDFYTGGNLTTPRMRIDVAGKVGIGTTTPGALLEVNGTAKFNGTTTFGSSITQNLNGGNFSFISSNGTAAANAQLNLGIGSTPSNFGIISNTNGPLIFSTFGSIRMQIDKTTGNVGIGTTTPSAKLEVAGGIKCVGAVDTSSDARFKLHVAPLSGALAQTLRLRGVSYDWNRAQFPDKGFNDRHQLGFIAQEVREILPEVASEDAEGYLSIGYTAIIPVLAEAVKELKQQKDAEIAALKADNAALAQKLTALEARDAAREARLTKLESALDERPARAVTAAFDLK